MIEISWIAYAIVCPLVFLAGFVDAIGGGGGIISLPAYIMAGVPAPMAIGTNKLSSATGTIISTARYVKNGFVLWKVAIPSIILALIGSTFGAHLMMMVDESILKYVMLVILPITAAVIFLKKDIESTKEVKYSYMLITALAASFLIGMYDGFYGPGTGTFLILIFTGISGMDTRTASGNTKLVNLSSNIAALATFIVNGKIIYPLGFAAALFCVAGHYVGSGFVIKHGQKIVKPIIIAVLIMLVVKVLFDLNA